MRRRPITIILEADEEKTKPKGGKDRTLDKEKLKKKLEDAGVEGEDNLTLALDVISAIGVGVEVAGGIFAWTGAGALAAGAAAAVSAAADITNSIRMASKGNLLKAGMYAIFAVPIVGDTLQGVKVTEMVGENGVKMIGRFIKFAKAKKQDKAISTSHDLIDKVADKVPGSKSYASAVKEAINTIMSGDPDKIAALAEKSGEASLAKGIRGAFSSEGSDEKESLSESRRSRSLLPLYEGTLYKKRDRTT